LVRPNVTSHLLNHLLPVPTMRGRGFEPGDPSEIPVTKESLHLDMIREVGTLGMGPKKGSYLGERATMLEVRQFYQSLIFNSEPFEQWERKGKKDDLTLAKEKADWILKNH